MSVGEGMLVAAAGGLGAIARYVLDGAIQERTSETLPFGTLAINVLGSFTLGVIAGLSDHIAVSPTLRAVLGVGFCGGFTTFSAASYESYRLCVARLYRRATVVAVGGAAISCLAAAAGLGIGLL